MGTSSPTVFAVIPVFNRLHFTLECIRRLQSQTYMSLVVILSDGGSTDGTPDAVRSAFPEVIVLTSDRELWWAGSTALGVEYALAKSMNTADFVLMLNNDTEIPDNYVETLVTAAQTHCATVGALIVDSRDPTRVLDAGEYISWSNYNFPLKTTVSPGERYCNNVDVLPGRGSLVPLRVIREVGNIDADRFPHYLADYEFFYRIKSHGFPLGICYETHVLAHIEETGIVPGIGVRGFRQVWSELFSRRSMGNIVDHWRFVTRHAPKAYRIRLQLRLLGRAFAHLGLRTPLRHAALPVYWVILLPNMVVGVIVGQIRAFRSFKVARAERGRDIWCYPSTVPGLIRGLAYLLLSPGPVHIHDCARHGLNPSELIRQGVLKPLPIEGWFKFTTLEAPQGPASELLDDARNVWIKVRRTLTFRKASLAGHATTSTS
jgi:GT2 family glycosyltransferase